MCGRPLRRRRLCHRCRPAAPNLSSNNTGARCSRCFVSTGIINNTGHTCTICTLFPPLAARIRFLWDYGDLPRDLIRAMKYRPSIWLTRYAGRVLSENLPLLFDEMAWDLIVPVPSSPLTLRRRQFNQCAVLAYELKLPVKTPIKEILKHTRVREPQARLNHEDRLVGMRSLIKSSKTLQPGTRVLLVEDVLTTGATTAAAVQALHEAGAESVDIVALARSVLWGRFRSRIFHIFGGSSLFSMLFCGDWSIQLYKLCSSNGFLLPT